MTYKEIVDSVAAEIDDSRLNEIPSKTFQEWVNRCQQTITQVIPTEFKVDLRLLEGIEDYFFDTSVDITGTGTIVSTAGSASIAGTSTVFLSEVVAGSSLRIGGLRYTVRAVDSDEELTLESAATSTLSAAFVYSGRASEISNELMSVTYIDRQEDDFRREVKIWDIDELLNLRKEDFVPVYTNFDIPYVCAVYKRNGKRTLKVYDVPDEDKTISLYGRRELLPRNYTSDDYEDEVQLSGAFEQIIREYLIYKVYQFLKNKEEEAKHYSLYNQFLSLKEPEIQRNRHLRIRYV